MRKFIFILLVGLLFSCETKPSSPEVKYDWTLKVLYKESKTDTIIITSHNEPYLATQDGNGVIKTNSWLVPHVCYVSHFEIIDKKIHN
jgi:hypothetical protein